MMATQSANGSPLTLAVYVVGISGKCSTDYVGCGKSCLCRQFIYGEYSEEPCSTLLQAEFDSCVISQQHVIYWGQKEEIYANTSKEKSKKSTFSTKINYEVFEHTILYEDASSLPFAGKSYNQQIFTPLNKFLNKFSFKTRDLILYPEEYNATMFSYTSNVPVAYLYVVDVSQSCLVFKEQLQLLNGLVKSIKKNKNHCVIVANKYECHSKENMENLAMCASVLGISVIQCSTKYNTNIDNAFKYLAVKVFSRQLKKKLSVNIQTHAEVTVEKRTALPSGNLDDAVDINTIPHISLAASKVSSSSVNSHTSLSSPMFVRKLQNGTGGVSYTATTVQDMQDGINNVSHAMALKIDQSSGYDDYDFPPDAMDNRPTIYFEPEDYESDDSFDDDSEPEMEKSVKRSASFGKAAIGSLTRSFIAKMGKRSASSSQTCLISENSTARSKSFGSIQHPPETSDHLKVYNYPLLQTFSTFMPLANTHSSSSVK